MYSHIKLKHNYLSQPSMFVPSPTRVAFRLHTHVGASSMLRCHRSEVLEIYFRGEQWQSGFMNAVAKRPSRGTSHPSLFRKVWTMFGRENPLQISRLYNARGNWQFDGNCSLPFHPWNRDELVKDSLPHGHIMAIQRVGLQGLHINQVCLLLKWAFPRK